MKTLFSAKATSTSGRAGTSKTDNGRLSFDLTPPGAPGNGTNPEELFACGYAACFGGAVDFVAKQQKLSVGAVEVKSEVNLNQDDSGFFLTVTLDVALPNMDQAAATKLVEAAHQVCPYSKATRGNINVTVKANGQPLGQAQAA